MKKKVQRALSLITLLVLTVSGVVYYQTDSLQDHLDARIKRKEAKKLVAKGRLDDEKRIRGIIVPSTNGSEVEDLNAEKYPAFHKVKEFEKALANAPRRRSTVSWTERGPGNFSGRVTSIAVDPNNINNIFVGTAGGGVFKTTNKGQSWTAVTETLPNLTITRVAMSAANSSVIYAGTGDTFANDGSGDGIYKSTNSGSSWTRLSSTENDNFKWASNLIVNQSDENHIVAATKSGVFYSTNGGTSFTNSSLNGVDVTSIVAKHGDFTTQYATVREDGIYRSTNSGQTWTKITSVTLKRMTLAVAQSNTAVAYVLGEGGTDGKGYMYKTSNSGASWSSLNQTGSFQNVFQTHGTNSNGGQGWYDQSIVVNPNNSNEVYVGGIDLYRATVSSSNVSLARITHGYSWSPDAGQTPMVHVDQHAAVAISTGGSSYELFFGNDGGVYHTSNAGSSYTNLTDGLRNVQFYSAQKHPSQYKFVAGAQDNGTFVSPSSPSETSDWGSFKIGGDGFGVVWHQGNSNLVIGGSQNGNLRKSTNGGSSFGSMSTPWSSAPFINKIGHSTANNDRIVFSGSGNIYVSNNFGSSWSTKTPPRTAYTANRASNVVSEANANYIWVADAIGVNNGTNLGVFRSTNGGSSFTETTVPAEFQSGAWYVAGFAAHPSQVNTGYLLMSLPGKPHITRTTDGGSTWQSLTNNNGFPDVATYCLAVNPNDLNEIWVGTEIGLFVSNDNGATWSYSNSGLPAVMVRQITFSGSTVIVATFGRGLFTAELSTSVTLNVPTNVTSSNITTSSATISWTDNNTQEDGYKLERALGNGSFSEIATVNGSSYVNSGLAANTAYRYRVRAYKGSTFSGYSSIVNVTTQDNPVTVTAPSGLTSSSITSSQVVMTWTDNSNNEDGFRIERSTGGSYTQVGTVGANTNSFTNTGLSANTQYNYRVLAYKASTNSSFSNVLTITTDPDNSGSNNYETNDSFAQAKPIATNTTIRSYIQSNGDEDYFSFSVPKAGAINVKLQNFPGDYDVFLYNSSQSQLGRGYTTNDPEIVDYNATGAATFYIRVDGYRTANSSSDDYELIVTFTETSTATWHYSNLVMESDHPYANYTNHIKSYSQPGAEKVMVHFSRFETEANYDFVYIKDKAGATQATHHGTKSEFWAEVVGDKIDVNFVSDYSVTDWGYKIDQVAYYSATTLSRPGVVSGAGFSDIEIVPDGQYVHLNNEKGNDIDVFATKQEFDTEIPTSFHVAEAYPNPFNPTTTIKYFVPERSAVRVEILNVLGQVIKTLVNGNVDGGQFHEVKWNADNNLGQKVSSGVYFYRVSSGVNTKISKLVLLK